MIRKFVYALVLLLSTNTVWCAEDKALFWQLKTDNATVYLFGSIHLANASFYPLRPEIEKAFTSADALAVEADILKDPVEQQLLMFKYGMYPAGEKLTSHISEKTYQLLKAALIEYQIPLPEAMAVRMRPGMLMLTLGYMAAEKAGLDTSYGLDLYFLKQAKASQKTIIELEGSEQLIKLLADLGPADFLIRETVKQLDDATTMMAPMVAAWKAGDENSLEKLTVDSMDSGSPESDKLMDVFLYDRNRGMAEKVEDFIKRGGTYFVVAGSAHFVGDKGVPALLRTAGYSLERK